MCTYVPSIHGYACADDLRGTTCAYGGSTYKCGEYRLDCDGASLANDGVCRAYCLSANDCRSNEKCSVYSELGYGVCFPK